MSRTIPFFQLTPAGRATAITLAFFFGMLGLSSLWLFQEARRIAHERELTRAANAKFESDVVWIPSGKFTMGGIGDEAQPDELPLHDVKLDGFYLDKTEVTNAQFARFIKATGYVTRAERPAATALCFHAALDGGAGTWERATGADWRHPGGPQSSIDGMEKHPVVQVCLEDALAFAKWAGKRLPTEAEWEYAARGGSIAQPYIWGSSAFPNGRHVANTWQDPSARDGKDGDGFAGLAPVKSFPVNGYGLFEMAGNAAELTADWYRADTYALIVQHSEREARHDPTGPEDSLDPAEPGVPKRVVRGGSWTSSDTVPRAYRPSARARLAPEVSRDDIGFRCAKTGEEP